MKPDLVALGGVIMFDIWWITSANSIIWIRPPEVGVSRCNSPSPGEGGTGGGEGVYFKTGPRGILEVRCR